MSVGHESETSGAVWRGIRTSWVREFFKIPLAYAPGERFVYTSAASYMLSAILTRLTGQTMHDLSLIHSSGRAPGAAGLGRR